MKKPSVSSLFFAALVAAAPAVAHGPAAAPAPTVAAPAAAPAPATTPAANATPEEAKAWVKKVNDDLKKLYADAARADWVKNTYITDDTEVLSADAAVKAAEVQLCALRVTPALGGRAYYVLTGAQSDVEAAVEAGLERLGAQVYRAEVVPNAHSEFLAMALRRAPFSPAGAH